jgi:hypothetical protein
VALTLVAITHRELKKAERARKDARLKASILAPSPERISLAGPSPISDAICEGAGSLRSRR